MEESLVFGVLEVEHEAAVFTLVAIVRDVEQTEHFLLDSEGYLPDVILRHDQVIAVADPFPQNLLQGASYILPNL